MKKGKIIMRKGKLFLKKEKISPVRGCVATLPSCVWELSSGGSESFLLHVAAKCGAICRAAACDIGWG